MHGLAKQFHSVRELDRSYEGQALSSWRELTGGFDEREEQEINDGLGGHIREGLKETQRQ
jgi:hypothetical protein